MKKALLMILDGYGISKTKVGNAVLNANTPNLDKLQKKYPSILMDASGEAVGLPKSQIGNSEVGHLHIGAGRVIYTGLSLINKSIADGTFAKNKALLDAIKHAKKHKSTFHVIGLFSPGGVHSLQKHIMSLLKIASASGVRTTLHLFGDGRDVPPQSIYQDLKKALPTIKKLKVKLGTIVGRYYAMDRDQRWDRIDEAYDALINGSKVTYKDPLAYIDSQYKKKITDEFLKPATNQNEAIKDITIQNNDAVFFANFRPDRARQLAHYIYGSKYYDAKPKIRRKNLFFVTMMQYEGIEPSAIAFPQILYKNTLGEVISKNKLTQLRIAETEKYAHVTFFFDGGVEIDYAKETKILIPSNKEVSTYDQAPEMSCEAITDRLLKEMKKYNLTVLNYANPDMVGHTGKYNATVKALEALDKQIGRVMEYCEKEGITIFFTADHGNAEVMLDSKKKPVTKHTSNPVPFVCTDKSVKFVKNKKYSLADVAPTILQYFNIKVPKEMTGKQLLVNKK